MDRFLQALLMTDYTAYCSYTMKDRGWKPTRFHKSLCGIVQNFIEKNTGHAYDILILSTPPQHGKSTTVTETLPSWYLGRNPNGYVIEVSYSEDFAKKFGKRNREKIHEFGADIFGISIGSPDSNLEFELTNGVGRMISRGITSGVTGNPANLFIIDDPIKTREDADSESYRSKLIDEWDNSFKTRLAPGAKVILIMTRWHPADLAGYILETEENVSYVNYPVEAEKEDILGRQIGEALCPEIGRDDAWLADFKASYKSKSGSRAWNALYMGHPTDLEGGLFKREWWRDTYETLPHIEEWLMSVDAAFKDGDDNDYVAIQVWGKTYADIYLIDAVKKHLNLPDTMREIIRLRSMYPQCVTTLIEDKANGSAIIDMLRRSMPGIIPVIPNGGKVSRANAIVGAIESGNVHLPEKKNFTNDFIEECAAFPNGAHDDQVDAMTQALTRLIYRKASGKPKLKDDDPFEKAFPGMKKKKKRFGKGEKINVI